MPGHFRLLPLTAEERLLAVHESHPRFHAFRSDPSGELARTTLLTSYLDEAAKRPGRGPYPQSSGQRLGNQRLGTASVVGRGRPRRPLPLRTGCIRR